jgi:glycine C-acetyltransferase
MVKIYSKGFKTIKGPLGKWAHRLRAVPKLEGELGPRMQFGKDILNWSLNDYLGLANHLRVETSGYRCSDLGERLPNGAHMMSGQLNIMTIRE